ncbi:hypothetical protein GQ457_02G033220 [Hibiscus cannabinus]
MAYIPPHKRQSKDSERPSPMPTPTPTPTPTLASLSHRFNRNVRLGASKFKAVYSNQAISRWFAVGWNGHGDASAAHLKPVSVESFERSGNIYYMDLSDNTQPDSTIFCKCRINDGKKLQLYKLELNLVRDMVMDISCMDKDLDLRLSLTHKRVVISLHDDEIQCIQNLINSAVLDPDMKGGLRWPFGKASNGSRYNVIGVWHTNSKAYENASIRLKVRHVDRFDFRTTYREASNEVVLKLKGIASGLLQEQDVETNAISGMLQDILSLIWQHFLQCEPFLF